MKKTLLLALVLTGQFLYAQNNGLTCETPYSLCNGLGVPFANSVNTEVNHDSVGSFGCLGTMPNPSWFSLPVGISGTLDLTIEQYSFSGQPMDVNFIAWGPFNDSSVCGPESLNSNTQVACSYAPFAVEQLILPNAVAGTYYIIMTSNFQSQSGTITFNPAGSTSPNALNCDVAGVIKIAGNNFMLYPNPAKNSINITATVSGNAIKSVKIYDLTGKIIYTTKANAESLIVDTSTFAAGTYLAEVINSKNDKTIKKLIIN